MIDYNVNFKTSSENKEPLIKWKPQFAFLKNLKTQTFALVLFLILLSSIFGFLAGAVSGSIFYFELKDYLSRLNIELPVLENNGINIEYTPQTTQEQAVINAVKEISPAVVSIVVYKEVPILEQSYTGPFGDLFGDSPFFRIPTYTQKGTEKQKVEGGTGFIISKDGMIVTNKHVALDDAAEYSVLTNDGKEYPAEVLAKDPVQDLAILKIEGLDFPTVKIGDSDFLQIGQTVIAIGNALGEFQNTVSVGVISGLGRTITVSGGGMIETLEDIIQTDAAINKGNSGGPLLNLKGEVIGINTAVSLEGQNIGFTIPINKAKNDIAQVKESGEIVYPFLGVYYVIITSDIQKENNLPVDYGALIISGQGADEKAIYPGSPAEKAGLKEGDIILEFDGKEITTTNSLAKIISNYNIGDEISLKVLRNQEEKMFSIILAEKSY
jgi:serine protease Do